jgi:hypothetical protein
MLCALATIAPALFIHVYDNPVFGPKTIETLAVPLLLLGQVELV